MSKRKVQDSDSDLDVSSTDSEQESGGEDMVDVDFDYFDINPDVDFQACRNFLRQLLGEDSVKFDISALADLVLKDNHIGSTVKTDGKEGDPFSLISVVNVNENLSKPCLQKLVSYLFERTSGLSELNAMLRQLLTSHSKFKTGLIVSERLINMPVETVPPLYKMLLQEISESNDASYKFDYFLVLSRVYDLVSSVVDKELNEDNHHSKKKRGEGQQSQEMDYFHYEDAVLEKHAMCKGYAQHELKSRDADSRRVFTDYGIDPKISLMLLDRKKLELAVAEMEQQFPPY